MNHYDKKIFLLPHGWQTGRKYMIKCRKVNKLIYRITAECDGIVFSYVEIDDLMTWMYACGRYQEDSAS